MTGVAVKITCVPLQIVPLGLATTLTDGVTDDVMVIVNCVASAVELVTHARLEVIRQSTVSPFTSALLV